MVHERQDQRVQHVSIAPKHRREVSTEPQLRPTHSGRPHCTHETLTRHKEGSKLRPSVLIAHDIIAVSHMSTHTPVDGQGVRTRLEGSGKEADSP